MMPFTLHDLPKEERPRERLKELILKKVETTFLF